MSIANEGPEPVRGIPVGLLNALADLPAGGECIFAPLAWVPNGPGLRDYNFTRSEATLHYSAGSSPLEPEVAFERRPKKYFNLLAGDWLLSGPGTIATCNLTPGDMAAFVLTLANEED